MAPTSVVPGLAMVSSTLMVRSATQYQNDTPLLISPNPIAIGFLIFATCLIAVSGLVGLAIFIHGRRAAFGLKLRPMAHKQHDPEASLDSSVRRKTRLASPVLTEKSLGPVSVGSGVPRDGANPEGEHTPNTPTEILPDRYTLSLNYDLQSDLPSFHPQFDSVSSRGDNGVASPGQHTSVLSSASSASVSSAGENDYLCAYDLFLKLETAQTHNEETTEPRASSSAVGRPVCQTKKVASHDLAFPRVYAKFKIPTIEFGSGLFIVAITITNLAKQQKDKLRHLPPSKRSAAKIVAGVRHPCFRKARSSLKGYKFASGGYLPKGLPGSPSPHSRSRCLLFSMRLFLWTTYREKLQARALDSQQSFLEISGHELEQDITDFAVTSFSSASEETGCKDGSAAAPQELLSFFAWNDTTAVDSQVNIAAVSERRSFRSPLANSSAGNTRNASLPDVTVTGSESTMSSLLGKNVKRVSDTMKKAVKGTSPKHGSPTEELTRGGSLTKKKRRRSHSTSPQLRVSTSGHDQLYDTRPRSTFQRPTAAPVSIAINGVPASDLHFASSFYVSISPPCSPPTTLFSPDLLNIDWAPRPPLRERTIMVSMRLVGRGFGALKGRSMGCYATMESSLESVTCAVEEQLGCEVVFRGMVRPSSLSSHDMWKTESRDGDEDWVYTKLLDDEMFRQWVEERVLSEGEGAALDVCRVFGKESRMSHANW